MELRLVKERIGALIASGSVGPEVVKCLIQQGNVLLPKETALWDYKEFFEADKSDFYKSVKHITAFYNTHGGYLIYGVKEVEQDRKWEAVGISSARLDFQKLKTRILQCCGQPIDISYMECDLPFDGEMLRIGILHIPKRPTGVHSISMIVDAHDAKTKIFAKNSTFIRRLDETVQASTHQDFNFLSGDRPIFEEEATRSRSKLIVNNLPARSFICSYFVGRTEIIQTLWAWLGDDLESVKVLAGEGGKGKTSIAYEFASMISESSSSEFDQVIWLTAKKKQFKANIDEYMPNPHVHFSDFTSFLEAVCIEVGGTPESDFEDIPIEYLKRHTRECLDAFRTLLIVDDVDSMPSTEDQKRILEVARAVATNGSKILLTTRANITYSQDIAITVPGLCEEEFSELADHICEIFQVKNLTKKQMGKLLAASEGSPLYAESILRLHKLGYSLDQSIKDWKGKQGEAVRSAALQREIELLSLESRKVLYTIAKVETCSLAEIKDYTELERIQLDDCISELGSLFLIQDAPIIETEPRYEVSRSISSTIHTLGDQLIHNVDRFDAHLEDKIRAIVLNRSGTKREEVAKAISQANALIRDNKLSEAKETVGNVLKKPKYTNNPDLLLTLAKVAYFDRSESPRNAKKLFADAFHAGQRKELLFDLWYETELLDSSDLGALEVTELALAANLSSPLWNRRAAEGKCKMANRSSSFSRKITLLVDAYTYAAKSLKYSPIKYKEDLRELSKKIVDQIWSESKSEGEDEIAFKAVVRAINAGDIRGVNYHRAATSYRTLRDNNFDKLNELTKEMNHFLDGLHEMNREDLISEIELAIA